jgi:hypothetical protein
MNRVNMGGVMVDLLRRWTSVVIVCATSLALNGCLITNMSGGTVNGLTTVQATAQLLNQSPCVVDAAAQTTTCTPVMKVEVPGLGTQTFQFLIKLLGYALPLHLYDPLIVQVPASMSNFAGSIAVGPPGIAPDTPLSIISGLTSVPIDAHTNLVAEPGMQLVIVDFQAPDNAPFGTYTLKLQFSGTTNSIKVMFAAKITAGAAAYYVPIFPCVTDFASVLPIALPVTNLGGVVQLILSAQACTGVKSYDFSGLPTTAGVELNQQGLTGSWYEPATGGQGFELEVFPNSSAPGTGLAFVSWFTYDSVVGGAERQRWYTLSGPVVSGQPNSSLTIYQNTGGNFNAPPTTASTAVGTATMSFDSCTSGLISYNFTDGSGRAGSIPLTRLTQNVTCSTTSARPTNADFGFSGNWYDPATSGQGITVEVNPNSKALFFAWYTYLPSGAGAGAAGQRWYTGQQTAPLAPGARTIPVQIYETTGGSFDTPTNPAPNTVAVGSGTVAFQSCSSATLSYNFTGGSSSGKSGTIALSRVGPVPAGCAL